MVDLRPAIGEATRRLTPSRFVRHTGPPRVRRREPVPPWPADRHFWHAGRAVRFGPGLERHVFCEGQLGTGWQGAFRRLFWEPDEIPVTRVELGLVRVQKRRRMFRGRLRVHDVGAVAKATLELPVELHGLPAPRSVQLGLARDAIAMSVLRATTHWAQASPDFTPEPWWVVAGRPLLVVDLRLDEVDGLPEGAEVIDGLDCRGLELAHRTYGGGDDRWQTWFLLHDPQVKPDILRRFRLHLGRLHAELEALRLVLEVFGDSEHRLALSMAGAESEWWLEDYLDKAIGLLCRETAYGLPLDLGVRMIFSAAERAGAVSPAEFMRLLERAEHYCPHLAEISARKRLAKAHEGVFLLAA